MTDRVQEGMRVELREKRDLYSGFGNALSVAIELAGTPIVFALIGAALDRWLGTGHLFLIVLAAFAVVGMAVRSYYAYSARMQQEEKGKPWARQ